MTEISPAPRAVAIGMPDRIRDAMLVHLPDVLAVDSLTEAAAVLDDNPRALVLYGEVAFGAVVSGQPVFLLEEQRAQRVVRRVGVVIDTDPNALADLEWDDPRRLAVQAGVRLAAGFLVDVSVDGVWGRLSNLLDERVAEPPVRGVTSGDGNDEPNGDPDDRDQPPAAPEDH